MTKQILWMFLVVTALLFVVGNGKVISSAGTEYENEKSPETRTTAAFSTTSPTDGRQLFLGAKGGETSTPNFVRLFVMRLIYGIASTMGIEERLEDAFNGAFVPPNADNDILGFGGGDEGDGIAGLFDDDY